MKHHGYSDMVALLEWATRNKKEKRREKREFGFDDYMKFKKKLEEFEKWEKEALKKDVKQEKKKEGLSAPQMAMILLGSFPITAPLYVWAVKQILN